jgi:hypothetical protein
MDGDADPYGTSIFEAGDLSVVFVIPNCYGEKDQNGDKQELKKKFEICHIVPWKPTTGVVGLR